MTSLLKNTATEGIRAFEVVLSDFGSISREKAVLLAGQTLIAGTVLGRITDSGKYALHDPDATDGSQTAVAVLLVDCTASGADAPTLILARLAEVKSALLTFKSGITAQQKAAALAALATQNIVAR
jgi:hypothetical protein